MCVLRIKYISIIVLFLGSIIQPLNAQLNGGIKLGLNTYEVDKDKIIIQDPNMNGQYELAIDQVNFGYQGGVFARISVWNLFIQLETLVNSNKVTYKLNELQNQNVNEFYEERYTYLTMPGLIGIKKGWLNVHGGINGHYNLISTSELENVEGFSLKVEDFTYGFLIGFGLETAHILFDFRYEISLDEFGDHIVFNGNTYQFSDRDNRIMMNISYMF